MLRLRSQILLIALLPALLLALTIGSYLLATRIADLRDSQQTLGESIVRHLAPASEHAVLSGNREVLSRLSSNLVSDANINQVRILNTEGEVLAKAEAESKSDHTSFLSRLYPVKESDLLFSETIELGDQPSGDFEALFADRESYAREDDSNILGKVELQLSTEPLMQRQAQVLSRGLAMILGGLLLVWIIAVRAGLKIATPINKVVEALGRFRDGQQDIRVPLTSKGEAGLLEQGFNDLAENIQSSHQHLEAQVNQATSELRETLEAVEIQNVELDLARKRAEASNQIKSEFLANISHEIRTPMNAIFGYAQLLGRTPLENSQKEYLATVQRSAESLLALLEDVLNLSRIEAGRVELEVTICQPEELIEDTLAMMAPGIFSKGLELIWAPQNRLPDEIFVDKVKLRQILGNLLSNAGKFTEEGYVKVESYFREDEQSSQLEISVIDTGIGIRNEDNWKLFQAFSQLDSSSSRRHQGAGLGLVICQQLTQLMGGQIKVDSEPSVGTRFTVSLPIRVSAYSHNAPLADTKLHLYSSTTEMAEALCRRLENLGATVNIFNSTSSRQSDGIETDSELLIIELGQEQINSSAAITEIAGKLPGSDRAFVLVSSLDRDILQKIEERFSLCVLPRTISSKQLLKHIKHQLDTVPERAIITPGLDRSNPLSDLDILVVEDNRINRQLTVEFLEEAGAKPRTAVDGPDAFEQCKSRHPDIILMDIQLPGMDGLDTSKAIRDLPGFPPTPIVALTASASEEERRRCELAGLDDVLVKPVHAETLINRIRYLVNSELGIKPKDRPKQKSAAMGRNKDGALKPDIARMVLDDLPPQLEKSTQCCKQNDWHALDAEVHRIRGTAAFCGFYALAKSCEAIRLALGESEKNQTIPPLMKTLEAEVHAVLEEIQTELSE